jgi:hypothetical protein
MRPGARRSSERRALARFGGGGRLAVSAMELGRLPSGELGNQWAAWPPGEDMT